MILNFELYSSTTCINPHGTYDKALRFNMVLCVHTLGSLRDGMTLRKPFVQGSCCLPGRVSATGNGRFCVGKWAQRWGPVRSERA